MKTKLECKICGGDVLKLFDAKILGKYSTDYYQCQTCDFIQTDEPHWLNEAYEEAISDFDLGYVTRNIYTSQVCSLIIKFLFGSKSKFLDYGGGYGLFVRMMRDKGFDFFLYDPYCQNFFANHFQSTDSKNHHFELTTAFELFEHLKDPLIEIEKMFQFSDHIFFSTELVPTKSFTSSTDWWYFIPESGQHIAFYSEKSLKVIAKKFKCEVYSNGKNFHLLTRKKHLINPVKPIVFFKNLSDYILRRNFFNKSSLIKSDLEYLKTLTSST